MPGPNQPWEPGGSPGAALGSLRRLWWAMVGYQAVLGAVLIAAPTVDARAGVAQGLAVATVVLMATVLPLGLFGRNQVYKRHWREEAITPRGYWVGNLLLFAATDLVVFVGLVALLFREQWWPAGVPTLVAFALELVNYPHGQPMRPVRPGSGGGP